MKEGLTPLSEEFVKRFEGNDLEGVVALYAPDAVLYPPDATEAIGTEAIRKAWAGLMNAFTVQKLIIAPLPMKYMETRHLDGESLQ